MLTAVILASGVALSLNIADPDLWGHVQYGRDALAGGLPATTTYSYIAQGYPWINHEILAELALALSYDYLGAWGLMLIKVGLGMGVIALMIRRARQQKVGLLATAAVALLVAVCLANHWTLRPQIISYVSFALLLSLLGWCFESWEGTWQVSWPRFLSREQGTDPHPGPLPEGEGDRAPLVYSIERLKYLWLVPILMIVWTNSHGGFLAGYCVFLAYLGLRGLEVGLRKGWAATGLLERFGLFAAVAGLATFINPYGLNFHLWLLGDLGVPRPEIVEWRAPNLFEAHSVPFVMLACTWLATLVISKRPKDFTQLVILGLLLWQSLVHLRHIAFFAIALGFWLPPHLDSLLTRFKVSKEGESPADALSPLFLRVSWTGLIAAWLCCGVQLFFQCREIRVEQGSYPVSAIRYIAGQKLEGKLLCTFNWAQYALAALGPDQSGKQGLLVHVDGRCRTSYSQQMLDEHFDFVMGNVGPEMRYRGPENKFNPTMALERGNPDLALISRLQKPSVDVMKGQGSAWVLLYQDELAQVWGRAAKYTDPVSPSFIPPARRQIGDAKQAGFAKWPAIPARHQPESQANENIASSLH
ncbi:MAG: hypothetical protein IAF94_15775 [Pirellulaceae bacterium]|nr:hypothetical protein [Pirellulaceae bacterium]